MTSLSAMERALPLGLGLATESTFPDSRPVGPEDAEVSCARPLGGEGCDARQAEAMPVWDSQSPVADAWPCLEELFEDTPVGASSPLLPWLHQPAGEGHVLPRADTEPAVPVAEHHEDGHRLLLQVPLEIVQAAGQPLKEPARGLVGSLGCAVVGSAGKLEEGRALLRLRVAIGPQEVLSRLQGVVPTIAQDGRQSSSCRGVAAATLEAAAIASGSGASAKAPAGPQKRSEAVRLQQHCRKPRRSGAGIASVAGAGATRGRPSGPKESAQRECPKRAPKENQVPWPQCSWVGPRRKFGAVY